MRLGRLLDWFYRWSAHNLRWFNEIATRAFPKWAGFFSDREWVANVERNLERVV